MAKHGVKVNKKKLEQIIRTSPDQFDTALRELAVEGVNLIVLSFGSSPPGATYGGHVASQAGYPPNVDTGALRASIRFERKAKHEYWIMDGVVYGYHLESGTSKMAARPFMRPAFEQLRKMFADKFRNVI
jgi:HK97 gp10 family phage protein